MTIPIDPVNDSLEEFYGNDRMVLTRPFEHKCNAMKASYPIMKCIDYSAHLGPHYAFGSKGDMQTWYNSKE